MREIKKVFLIFVLILNTVFLSGYSKSYIKIITEYKTSIIKADSILTNYYNNLYKYNQSLYFMQLRPINPQNLANYQINPDIIDDKSIHTILCTQDLQSVLDAINGIKKYTMDLYLLYTVELKHISEGTVSDVVNNIADSSVKNCWNPRMSNLGSSQTAKAVATFDNITAFSEEVDVTPFAIAITPVTMGLKQVVDKTAENNKDSKRNKYIVEVVQETNPIINNYLSVLAKNSDAFQLVIEQNIKNTLQSEINNYNVLVSKSTIPINPSNELLRLKRLDNINEEIQIYYSIQKNNPKAMISRMLQLQSDFVSYLENPAEKDSKKLLESIKIFNNYVSTNWD